MKLAKNDTMKYFRKIQNGRQIMFQCDRGYSMIEGPSGATCIAGLSHAKDHYDDNLNNDDDDDDDDDLTKRASITFSCNEKWL